MMREHLPKIILLIMYPSFLWAGSAFLNLVPDTKEGFGNVKERFANLTEAANIYDFMGDEPISGELPKEMTTTQAEALNGYPNYLAVAYAGTTEGSIAGYIAAITTAARESKHRVLAIVLPEIVRNDLKIAHHLRWVIGPTLTGSTFQGVVDDIKGRLSFPFPGFTAEAHALWAAILVNSCKRLDLKVASRSREAISLSFARDTRPIIQAYVEAARRGAEVKSAVPAVVADMAVRSSVGVVVAGAGGKALPVSDGGTDSLLAKGKPAAGIGLDPAAATGAANVALLRHEERSPPYKCKTCIIL